MAAPSAPRRSEQGFSVVESVIAIAVLGLIVAAMVGGMATSISTSDIHRQQSVANAVMVSAAETVKNMKYDNCARAYSPTNSLPPGWTADAVKAQVTYWNPTSGAWELACHDLDGSSLFPMQLVTIRVTNPGRRATTSVDVVKRRP